METLKDLHMMFIPEKIMIGDPPPHAGLCFCDWGLDILKVPSNKIRKKMERSGTYQLVCVAKDVKISSVSSKPTNGRIKQQINYDGKIQRPTHKSADVDISEIGILIKDDQGGVEL